MYTFVERYRGVDPKTLAYPWDHEHEFVEWAERNHASVDEAYNFVKYVIPFVFRDGVLIMGPPEAGYLGYWIGLVSTMSIPEEWLADFRSGKYDLMLGRG